MLTPSFREFIDEVEGVISPSFLTNHFLNLPIGRVVTDSRLVQEGDVFIALKGLKTDGHCFLNDVFRQGAKAAVINKNYQEEHFGLPLIRVEDPLSGLQKAAKRKIKKSASCIIGVTGSVGKTSTKDFLHTLFQGYYSVTATPGTCNSQVGLAVSILNHVRGDEEFLILEMGISEAGQLKNLVEIAPPDIALITRVALVHAENFPNGLVDIARAKGEILSHHRTKIAYIHHEAAQMAPIQQLGNCIKKTFCAAEENTEQQADCTLCVKKESLEFRTEHFSHAIPKPHFAANHFYDNLSAALAIGKACGLPLEHLRNRMEHINVPSGRLQQITVDGINFLEDTYNASEVSFQGALKSMQRLTTLGKKVAVIGQVLELGVHSEACHYRIGEWALDSVDEVLCLGPECKPIFDLWKKHQRPIEWFMNYEDLFIFLKRHISPGDLVLLKGSRKNRLERVLADW